MLPLLQEPRGEGGVVSPVDLLLHLDRPLLEAGCLLCPALLREDGAHGHEAHGSKLLPALQPRVLLQGLHHFPVHRHRALHLALLQKNVTDGLERHAGLAALIAVRGAVVPELLLVHLERLLELPLRPQDHAQLAVGVAGEGVLLAQLREVDAERIVQQLLGLVKLALLRQGDPEAVALHSDLRVVVSELGLGLLDLIQHVDGAALPVLLPRLLLAPRIAVVDCLAGTPQRDVLVPAGAADLGLLHHRCIFR
mmetsp:Transcript_26735/g.67464  ORF Transcript_26735/g.67464 Transcript_26735/m.67464 type:complete len:252 (-) Transcript_26735:82-837(-)